MGTSTVALFLSSFRFICSKLWGPQSDSTPVDTTGADAVAELRSMSGALTEIQTALTGISDALNAIAVETARNSAALMDIAIYGEQLRARGNLHSAYTLLYSGVFDEALLQFRKARELDPSNIALWSGIVTLRCRLIDAPRSSDTDAMLASVESDFPSYLEKALRLTYSCGRLPLAVRMACLYVLYSAAMQLERSSEEELAASLLIATALSDHLTETTVTLRTRPLLSLRPRGSIPSMLQRVTNLHWQFIRGDIEECVRKCQRGEYIYALATVTDLQKRFGLLPAYENIRGAIAHLETLLKAIDSDQKRVWDIEWKLKCEDPERIRREIQLNEFDRNSIWRTWVVITIVVFVLLVGFIGIIRTAVVIASLTAVFLVYLGIERFKRRRTVLAKVRATKETFPELQREASSIRLQLAANEEGVRAQVGVFKQALGIS